jgi:hypothetical protein
MQIKLADGRWFDENSTTIQSTLGTTDAAFGLRSAFSTDSFVNSVFPRFTQADMVTNYGYHEGAYEIPQYGVDQCIQLADNAIVLMAFAATK